MRLHPTRRAPPAEVSRVRGRPAFAARRLSSHSPRVRRRTRCRLAALLRDAGSTTRASPQPDPLGHLMSRDRRAPGGEPDAVRPPPQTSWSGTPPTIPPREPCSTCERESAGSRGPGAHPLSRGACTEGRGPLHPDPREEVRDRLHPRCLPSSSHPEKGYQAFALYRRPGRALSTGCHQPVENARRRAIAGSFTLRPGCLDGQTGGVGLVSAAAEAGRSLSSYAGKRDP